MEGGFYKGVWYSTQYGLLQQQMYDLQAASSNMPIIHPHFQPVPHRFAQGHRGGFRPPFPHHGQPRPNLIPIHPTQRGRHQADFQQQHHNHPPQAQEYPSEHQVIMPDNRETPMSVPQSTHSDVDTQNYVGPSVINSDQQAPSSGETLQHDFSQPPPLMEMNLDHVATQGGRQLRPKQNAGHEHNVMNETMVPHQSYNRGHDVNYAPAPNNYQQQTTHRDNFQHGMQGDQLQPQHYNKQHRNQRPWGDRNRAEPRGNWNHNSDQNQQQSADGGNFQQQQAHKQKKKRKQQKKNHYTDEDSSKPYENCNQNADSNQEHDGNFQHETPPRYQKQHKFRHDEKEYHQQPWGGPVPYQNYNHRGRGRGGYRGQHPRNYNYKPRYQVDDHYTPQTEHNDGGENQQAERNSDLLQEPAPLESPAMVAAAVSPEKTAEENSCEAIVNDIINSAAPEERSGIVEIPEEGSVIVETPEKGSGIVETPEEGPVIVETAEENQTTSELPDLSYIYTMNLVELQSLCSNICSESKNFWGPLEKMPHMVTKIETVIEILPQKCKDQSKVDVLVQDMQHCLSLLESRAPMIESAAGNDDYESSDSEEDEMHQTVSHIGMLAIGLYTRVRLNPVPTTEPEVNILQQQITKCQTDLDQLPIAEDDQVLVQSVGNIQVLCNDTHDLLLHRASNAPSELYSYST